METTEKLEKSIGGRWHAISFFADGSDIPRGVTHGESPRFCEALKMAAVEKVVVKPSEFTCPGACYAFGGMVDLKAAMIDKMVTIKGYAPEYAVKLFEGTPHFQTMPEWIGFDVADTPDIVMAGLQPGQVMRLLQRYHIKLTREYDTSISPVISACGNTAVKAFQQQDLAISFGCDESRTFGGLSQDRLYVGMPFALARELCA